MWHYRAHHVLAALASLCIVAVAAPAAATPNMIRLGYPNCQSCHLSPQGGGLMTSYGEGIDLAQTLRPREPDAPELGEDDLGARLNYDARLSLSIDRERGEDTSGYGFSTSVRTAFGFVPNNRLVYTASLRSPTLARTRTSGAVSISMSRLYWMYQPRDGIALVAGRDELPSGLGLPGANAFFKTVNNPTVSATPTQGKVFWWNERWQLTAYGYGPDGNETQPAFRARGAGATGAVNVWNDRAVVGLTTRVSHADAFDRRSGGVFARIGFNEHVGVLAEHDVTSRVSAAGRRFTHVAGHTEAFFVPVNWLQTALAVEHLATAGGASTYRVLPSAELRLTPNFRLQFTARNVYAETNSRTYSIVLQVKAE